MAGSTREQPRCITHGTTENDTTRTIQDLIAYPTELPWLEFKENWFEPHALGEYISALSNAMALVGRDCFAFQDNAIVVTIPFQRIDAQVSNKVVDKVVDNPDNESNGGRIWLNTTQQKVLDALRDNPNYTHPQLEQILGLGHTSIQNAIAYLRNNGYIERVGSRKTGWWKVLK